MSFQDQFYNRSPSAHPTVIGADIPEIDIIIYQGQVPNVGFRLLEVDQTPMNRGNIPIQLYGYGAAMQVRGRVDSEILLAEFNHCEGLIFDRDNGIIWLRPTLEEINLLPTDNVKREWVYDLLLAQPTGGPVLVAQGRFIVYPRVTRVCYDKNRLSNDMPRPPDILDVVVEGIQGPQGLPGEIANFTYDRITVTPLEPLTVVWEDSLGRVHPAQPNDIEHVYNIAGITIQGVQGSGGLVKLQYTGPITNDDWNLQRGRYWLGPNGSITRTPPNTDYAVLIGYATTAKTFYVDIQEPVLIEA